MISTISAAVLRENNIQEFAWFLLENETIILWQFQPFNAWRLLKSQTYLKERNCLRDKFSQFSRIFPKFAKLNPRKKSTGSQFVKLNPRVVF